VFAVSGKLSLEVCESSIGLTYYRQATPLLVQGGSKSDALLVFEFPVLLDALCLQFLFPRVSFSLNGVVLRLPM